MKQGRINLIVGAFGLLIAAIGGMALGATFNEQSIQGGNHLLTEMRFYIREGHSHGMPMAFLNLIYGLYIDRVNLSDRMKKLGSISAILAFMLPISLLAKGLAGAPANFPPIGVIGILGFVICAITLGIGAVKMKTAE